MSIFGSIAIDTIHVNTRHILGDKGLSLLFLHHHFLKSLLGDLLPMWLPTVEPESPTDQLLPRLAAEHQDDTRW